MSKWLSVALLFILASGPVLARRGNDRASDAAQITFGSNLFVDSCTGCNYNPNPSGFVVIGPRNCTYPGSTERVAVPFIASATGIPERISASLILDDPINCPSNQVTLALYTDACFPIGPGTLLASGQAIVPVAPCDLATAKLRSAPSLTKGTKYWVVATPKGQSGVSLDAAWYGSNDAQFAFNDGTGWERVDGRTPGFQVRTQRGAGIMEGAAAGETTKQSADTIFASNLLVDPCTGCNYDPNSGGLQVQGPDNCAGQSTLWLAVPFTSRATGIPRRVSVPIFLYDPQNCPHNKVTISLYTDDCAGVPGTLLVSAEATVPSLAQCQLTTAQLRNAPSLAKGTRYWVVATTTSNQSALEARWYFSNNAQLALDLDGWSQFTAQTPAFLVE